MHDEVVQSNRWMTDLGYVPPILRFFRVSVVLQVSDSIRLVTRSVYRTEFHVQVDER